MEFSIPTRAFFESDPKAAAIRDHTLDGVAACMWSLGGAKGCEGKIMAATIGLQELGVVAGMHLIESKDPEVIASERQKLLNSPVKAAEFVGGILLHYLYVADGALEMPAPTTPEEHETFARMFAEGDAPHEVRMAYADLGTLRHIQTMLDRQPDEFRPHP